ncbi:MAG TPA: enoyl-CoA hydratase-related protein, partial [Bacillota bacterium]
MPELLYERQGAIATLTLNRPEQRNAFTDVMIREWVEALQEARRDDRVHVVVLTGKDPAFCAGGDLKMIQQWQEAPPLERKNFLWAGVHGVPFALADLDKPVIAAVNGAAIGAGCDMALMCDMRIASERAVFAETYLLAGLVPGDGGAYFLPRVVGLSKAFEMLLTCERVDAQEAHRIGLVNRVVPHAELMSRTYEVAEKIAALPPA